MKKNIKMIPKTYKMRVGDTVLVLDEPISGVIIKIENKNITLLTQDDFELIFIEKELILMDDSLSKRDLGRMDVAAILSEKSQKKPGKTVRIKPKERSQPAMEVDLHIHQLVPKSKHLSNYEILTIQTDAAKRQLEFAISKRIQRVVFIHGVGEGVLRTELEYLFRRYENIKFYDADYQKYGRGATEIYILQNVK